MPDTTITLEYPFTSGGQMVTSITLRRPKVKDQIAAEKTSSVASEVEIAMMANLAGLAPKDIQELDLADYRKLQKAFEGFFSPAEPNSAKP